MPLSDLFSKCLRDRERRRQQEGGDPEGHGGAATEGDHGTGQEEQEHSIEIAHDIINIAFCQFEEALKSRETIAKVPKYVLNDCVKNEMTSAA